MKQATLSLTIAFVLFSASVLGSAQSASADQPMVNHVFDNVCQDGQELRMFGFTAWRLSAIYRMVTWDGNEYYMESYFDMPEGEGWGLFVIAEIRDVQSWERVSTVQIVAPEGLHVVWIQCFNGDDDQQWEGPVYREPWL